MTELATQVSLTIDGIAVEVPPGTLVIRAAEMIGVQIPRFCDHPLLAPVGACRQCLVEVEGQRKPMASCTIPVTEGMVVSTQLTSSSAEKAQRGVMELLLINHPLDCPVCDKGGECPLQNQAMSTGAAQSRFDGVKRTFPKPIPLSSEVLLDRERCVLCARCTRFSEQIAGDPFVELLERGALQQVGVSETEPLDSYFSGNTVQICPVGALTGAAYRFRARPFDLVSTPSVCEHCASGCAQRTDHRGGRVLRRMAGDDPNVNEEWNCDKGRWAFTYREQAARIETPLVRGESGELEPASWSHALSVAATGLIAARGRTGFLVGGRGTAEDAYAYTKFARTASYTNDIDFRARAHSTEESEFLAARIAATPMTVTYRDLETASVVLLVGFEPEEESPIVFLRLRKAARTRGVTVLSIAPFASRGLTKMSGTLIATTPGDEAATLAGLRESDLLGGPGSSNTAVIMVGERLASSPGALTAAVALADATGARLAWVPRRAGERGALDVGALPNLLPGGRPVTDPVARQEIASAWGVEDLPAAPGRDTDAILAAATAGDLDALVVGGVDPTDLADPEATVGAVTAVGFLVALELRHTAVTALADVVFPVAAVAEKSGTFVNWEGRPRPFVAALPGQTMSDLRVLDALAERMGSPLHLPDPDAALAEIAAVGSWTGARATDPARDPVATPEPGRGEAILASWRMLLDDGRLQDHDPHLAGTARPAVARLSADIAAKIGARTGDLVTVGTTRGSVTLPCEITAMPDRVVWVPLNSTASLNVRLGPAVGGVVTIAREPGSAS